MARKIYPEGFHDFMVAFVPGHTTEEVRREAKRRLGLEISKETIKTYKSNHHIRSGTKGGQIPGESKVFPREVQDYIRAHYEGVGPKEMTQRIKQDLDRDYEAAQLSAFYKNHHLDSGVTGYFQPGSIPWSKGKKIGTHGRSDVTQFKKGSRPANKTEIGTLRKRGDGYLWRKTGAGPLDWTMEHRLVWEAANGPIPEGMRITFADGNRENVELENLILVQDAVSLEMNRSQLRFSDGELTRTGAKIAELKVETRKRKKERT